MEQEVLLERLKGLERLVDERDKQYTARDQDRKAAIDAALKAQETLTNATFAASEKAIGKADVNAEKWRENANEWRTAMNDREQRFAPRAEVDQRLHGIEKDIAEVKLVLGGGAGVAAGGKSVKDESRANVAILVAVVGSLVSIIGMAAMLIKVFGQGG